tara:strand:+ start:2566 stop:3600 length:1035 start_codon:yes stop_codon:yes gene_type:complete
MFDWAEQVEGIGKMLKAHKVIDYFNAHDVSGGSFVGDKNVVKVKSHLAQVIDLSGKFDLGQHTAKDFDVLAMTGFDQLKANLVAMPYPYTYVEIELTSDPSAGDTFRGWGKGKYAVIIRNSAKSIAEMRGTETALKTAKILHKDFSEQEYDKVSIDEEYSSKWYIHVLGFNKKVIENVGGMVTVMTSEKQRVSYKAIHDPHKENSQEFDPLDEELEQSLGQSYVNMMGAIQAIVNAKGVDTRTILPPEKLNKKRIKKGKTPLYSHNVVTFGGISSSGNIVGAGMKRASPRQHWRRGFIRTLSSGKQIAIQATLVNGRGFISKEYAYANDNKKTNKKSDVIRVRV